MTLQSRPYAEIAGRKYVVLSCKECVPDGLRDCAGSQDEWFRDEYCRSCRKYADFQSIAGESAQALERLKEQSRARLVTFGKDDESMRKIGDRIGAILSADETTVKLLGYGTYVGDEVLPTGLPHDVNFLNPKLQLDNGRIVWEYQCWWGTEASVKKMIGDRKVVDAVIEDDGASGK